MNQVTEYSATVLPSNILLNTQTLSDLSDDRTPPYLLDLATSLVIYIRSLNPDILLLQQIPLQREIVRQITIPNRPPGRALRNVFALAVKAIFSNGGKIECGFVEELLELLRGSKARSQQSLSIDCDLARRQCAALLISAIVAGAGLRASAIINTLVSALLKQCKDNLGKSYSGFRGLLFLSISQIINSPAGKKLDPVIGRSVWKYCRLASTSSKVTYVQARALGCLDACIRNFGWCRGKSVYQQAKALIMKLLESVDVPGSPASKSVLKGAIAVFWAASLITHLNVIASLPTPKALDPAEIDGAASISPPDDDRLEFTLPTLFAELESTVFRFHNPFPQSIVFQTFVTVIRNRSYQAFEDRFAITLRSLLNVASSSSPQRSSDLGRRPRLLIRRTCGLIVNHGISWLSDSSKISSIQTLISELDRFLEKDLTSHTIDCIVIIISAISANLQALGSGASSVTSDLLVLFTRDPHSSYTVQVHLCSLARQFAFTFPAFLSFLLEHYISAVEREVDSLLSGASADFKCTGYAMAAAAILSVSSHSALFEPSHLYGRVMLLATKLLKSAASYSVRSSLVIIQVSWKLIGSLFTLPQDHVSSLLSQIMILWRNALPRFVCREQSQRHSFTDLAFLVHVRECALGSLSIFLRNHPGLMSGDFGTRIGSMLNDTIMFARFVHEAVHPQSVSGMIGPRPLEKNSSEKASQSHQLLESLSFVKRRVLQCAVCVTGYGWDESALIQSAVGVLAGGDPFSQTETSGASNFWECNDNYACGSVSGKMVDATLTSISSEFQGQGQGHLLCFDPRRSTGDQLDALFKHPITCSVEHDFESVLVATPSVLLEPTSFAPPHTSLVDHAVSYLAAAFVNLLPRVQESLLEQIQINLSSHSLARGQGRYTAASFNVAVLLSLIPKVIRNAPGGVTLPHDGVLKEMLSLLHKVLASPDALIRYVASVALGNLCTLSFDLSSHQIQFAIESIVSTPDPSARAGFICALSAIVAQVGIIPAGHHMKNVVALLNTLILDPHPLVHFWALESLSLVVGAAGQAVGFNGVFGLLTTVSSILNLDSHGIDANGLCPELNASRSSVKSEWANYELEWETSSALVGLLDAIIGVVGPSLHEGGETNRLLNSLLFALESEAGMDLHEAALTSISSFAAYDPHVSCFSFAEQLTSGLLLCQHKISFFAPSSLDTDKYLDQLLLNLKISFRNRDLAVRGLYDLFQRSGRQVLATPGFEQLLWVICDEELSRGYSDKDLYSLSANFSASQRLSAIILDSVGLSPRDLGSWLHLSSRIVMGQSVGDSVEQKAIPLPETSTVAAISDEEVVGFTSSLASVLPNGLDPSILLFSSTQWHWQFKVLCMRCIHTALVKSLGPTETNQGVSISQIGPLVNLSFFACTSSFPHLRIEGLLLLSSCIKYFAGIQDPDFPGTSILEQYAAQIGSAILSTITSKSGLHSSASSDYASTLDPVTTAYGLLTGSQFLCSGIVRDSGGPSRLVGAYVEAYDRLVDTSGAPSVLLTSVHAQATRSLINNLVLVAWTRMFLYARNLSDDHYLWSLVSDRLWRSPGLASLWIAGIYAATQFSRVPSHSRPDTVTDSPSFEYMYRADVEPSNEALHRVRYASAVTYAQALTHLFPPGPHHPGQHLNISCSELSLFSDNPKDLGFSFPSSELFFAVVGHLASNLVHPGRALQESPSFPTMGSHLMGIQDLISEFCLVQLPNNYPSASPGCSSTVLNARTRRVLDFLKISSSGHIVVAREKIAQKQIFAEFVSLIHCCISSLVDVDGSLPTAGSPSLSAHVRAYLSDAIIALMDAIFPFPSSPHSGNHEYTLTVIRMLTLSMVVSPEHCSLPWDGDNSRACFRLISSTKPDLVTKYLATVIRAVRRSSTSRRCDLESCLAHLFVHLLAQDKELHYLSCWTDFLDLILPSRPSDLSDSASQNTYTNGVSDRSSTRLAIRLFTHIIDAMDISRTDASEHSRDGHCLMWGAILLSKILQASVATNVAPPFEEDFLQLLQSSLPRYIQHLFLALREDPSTGVAARSVRFLFRLLQKHGFQTFALQNTDSGVVYIRFVRRLIAETIGYIMNPSCLHHSANLVSAYHRVCAAVAEWAKYLAHSVDSSRVDEFSSAVASSALFLTALLMGANQMSSKEFQNSIAPLVFSLAENKEVFARATDLLSLHNRQRLVYFISTWKSPVDSVLTDCSATSGLDSPLHPHDWNDEGTPEVPTIELKTDFRARTIGLQTSEGPHA